MRHAAQCDHTGERMDKVEAAKKILADIVYITIATASQQGIPWNTPVYAAYDHQYTFYWVSAQTARHSQNIREHNHVALVIYDSTVPEGTGEGVYIEAKAYELTEHNDIDTALRCLYGRKHVAPRPSTAFTDASPRRVYKAVPDKWWINGAGAFDGHSIDIRIEIDVTQ